MGCDSERILLGIYDYSTKLLDDKKGPEAN
jgi:hypothetical protein